MRARLIFATLGLAAFAACGGGGGGGGGGGSPIGGGSTPAPTNTDERPATTGDTFSYAGTTTTVFVRPPQINGAIPSPNPVNTQTLTYSTTQAQTVASGATYGGIAGAYQFNTTESDTLAGGLATTTSTNAEYYSLVPTGSSTLVRDLGGVLTTSAGTSVRTVNGANDGLIDVLPEVAGPIVPTNDAAVARTETDADTTVSVRSTVSNGTYTENDAFSDGTTGNAVANADGSGSYSFPVGLAKNAAFVVSAPSGTGTTATIPITITYPAGFVVTDPSASPTPYVVSRSVGVWYQTPLVPSIKTLADNGTATPPASCGVASKYASASGHAIVATASSVDPVFGELDSQSTTTYTAPGFGITCVQFVDTLQQFYDFSEQTGQIVVVRSTPVQTTTTTQVLGLTSETVVGTASIARVQAVAASRARFDAMLETRRSERRTRDLRALRAARSILQGAR